MVILRKGLPCLKCESENTIEAIKKTGGTRPGEFGRLFGYICIDCGHQEYETGWERHIRYHVTEGENERGKIKCQK